MSGKQRIPMPRFTPFSVRKYLIAEGGISDKKETNLLSTTTNSDVRRYAAPIRTSMRRYPVQIGALSNVRRCYVQIETPSSTKRNPFKIETPSNVPSRPVQNGSLTSINISYSSWRESTISPNSPILMRIHWKPDIWKTKANLSEFSTEWCESGYNTESCFSSGIRDFSMVDDKTTVSKVEKQVNISIYMYVLFLVVYHGSMAPWLRPYIRNTFFQFTKNEQITIRQNDKSLFCVYKLVCKKKQAGNDFLLLFMLIFRKAHSLYHHWTV